MISQVWSTDRRLPLDLVERHLPRLETGAYLVDEVHAAAGLNAYQPTALMGYPSMPVRLGGARPGGRVTVVDRLERHAVGKIRRFLPPVGC
jgi:hypothetical protein